jgi:hypothetical protein
VLLNKKAMGLKPSHTSFPISSLNTQHTQVLVATGLVSEREVRKYEREAREMGKASFYLAWLMDEDRCVV